jgi:hypothetical protein
LRGEYFLGIAVLNKVWKNEYKEATVSPASFDYYINYNQSFRLAIGFMF